MPRRPRRTWLALTCHEFKAKLSALSLAHPLRAVVEYPWGPVRAKKTLGIYATTVIFRGETKYKLRIHALNLLLEHLGPILLEIQIPPEQGAAYARDLQSAYFAFYGVCKWFYHSGGSAYGIKLQPRPVQRF
jgi:hypothetical protein